MIGAALGIDVGGTKIAAGVVSFPEAKILACEVRPTSIQRGSEAILDELVTLAKALCSTASVQAIGLAICELVDAQGTILSNNCIHWKSADVLKRFAPISRTIIEADVRAAALGEALFGAAKRYKNFLYVTIGTGISCCLMIDHKPYLGAHGLTGTFASTPLPGSKHSLEDLASGAALSRGVKSDSAAEALGAGIGSLVSTLDPEAVIIGGGLGLSGGSYWQTLVNSTRRHIWSPLHRHLPILPAATPHSALIGAAAAAMIKFASGS